MDLKCDKSFNSMCTSWNKGVRRILNLLHNAHTWSLSLLLKQNHIKTKLLIELFVLLFAC